MTWRPHPDLVHTTRRSIASAPEDGSGTRFEKEAWLALLEQDPYLLTREGAPAHFTASAFPVSSDLSMVCLVLHKRLGGWVQPGGHFERGDRSIQEAAARETQEETGLVGAVSDLPIGLSRHPAPCGVGDWHLDIRFALTTDADEDDSSLRVSDESRDVRWFPINQLPDPILPEVANTVASLTQAK